MTTLTDRQNQVLQIVLNGLQQNGFPPTVREVQAALGVSSVRGAAIHLEALERKGYLRRTGKARGLQILQNGKSGLAGEEIRIPLIGQIAAGKPIFAQENIQKYVSVKREHLGGASEAFLLRVQGDSMINAGISPNDLVVVTPAQTASNGDVVVALMQDEATLKKFYQVEGYTALLPANPAYAPIIGKEFKIQGRVVSILSPHQRSSGSLGKDSTLLPVYPLSEESVSTDIGRRWSFGLGSEVVE